MRKRFDRRQAWVSLYTLLAEGLKHPDERLYRDVSRGTFASELTSLTNTLSIPLPERAGDRYPVPESRAAFDNEYIALFEGLAVPYAPLIESVYRPWYETSTSTGLLSGPSAADMQNRYDAAGMSVPEAYAPDHLALLLEYAAALLRAGEHTAYLAFIQHHLDWLPALRRLTDAAEANAPFHSYCVATVYEMVATVRDREGITQPDSDTVREMCDRARTHVE